jgi:hypothetical protein
MGKRGILIIKDFTSILTADRNVCAAIVSALREIHDGSWVRFVGSDGGQSIPWDSRIVCIAACTTAWDTAYSVVAAMGPRFVTIRTSARSGRVAAGKRSIRNTADEATMRVEITVAVAALLAAAKLDPRDAKLTEDEEDDLVRLADVVTLARSAVETDFHGNVIDAHEPEMPTRFVKQLVLIFRGALSIGIERTKAFALVRRCARDSIPPLRLALLRDVGANDLDDNTVTAIADRLAKPWSTIRRNLEALYVLRLLDRTEPPEKDDDEDGGGSGKKGFRYSVASGADLNALGS